MGEAANEKRGASYWRIMGNPSIAEHCRMVRVASISLASC